MGEGPTPTGMAGTAADPGADPESLRQIAFHYPDLRPVVAANPAAYEGLLDWLAALGDPRVDAALAARGHVRPGAQGGAPVFAPTGVSGAPLAQNATPVQGVPNGNLEGHDGQGGPGRGGSRATRITLVVLVVAALVLLGVVWAIFRGASGGGESDQPTPASGTAQSSTASPSSTPTPSATAGGEVKYPAPTGAVAATTIVTPSGNIACDLQPDSVTCSIVEQSYAQNGLEDCGAQPFALVADATSATRACGKTVPGTGAQVPYGTAAVNGNSVCLSDENGMSCWNTVSGQSFALARQGWQTGNSGPIEPTTFLW
ncbi:MAG: hypothetical protein L0L69_07780 [Propionibacterium sp.]|nr:hypothetical protein [Propionibacterium sp.]